MVKRGNNRKSTSVELAYIGLCVAVMAVCSWVSIPTTVPVTLQTFAVFVIVALLGMTKGMMAVMVYIILGGIGLPVFSNFGAGLGVLLGPTGGFILGFVLIVLVSGLIIKLYGRSVLAMVAGMSMGLIACYIFGTLWFMMYYVKDGSNMSPGVAIMSCVVPFIIPDMVKMALAIILDKKVGKHLRKM